MVTAYSTAHIFSNHRKAVEKIYRKAAFPSFTGFKTFYILLFINANDFLALQFLFGTYFDYEWAISFHTYHHEFFSSS